MHVKSQINVGLIYFLLLYVYNKLLLHYNIMITFIFYTLEKFIVK
jgi:hypothetical protein